MDTSDATFAFARAMSGQSRIFNDQIAAAFRASKMFAALADGAVARSLLANTQWRPLPRVDEIMCALTRFHEAGNAWQGFARVGAVADLVAANNLAVRAFANISSMAWMASVGPLLVDGAYEEPEPDALPADAGGLLDAWVGALRELWAWMQTRQARGLAAAVGIAVLTAWWIPFAKARPDLANAISTPLWTVVAILFAMAVADHYRKD